jgi:hypothetical protein
MSEVKNGRWFSVAMMAVGLLVGGVSAGGVAKLELAAMDKELDKIKVIQADKLGRIEEKIDDNAEDIQWIRGQIERMLIRELEVRD